MSYLKRTHGQRRSKVSEYQNSASREFKNAVGNDYHNAVGSTSQIDSNDRTYTFNISLTVSTTAGIARLFGLAKDSGNNDAYNTANNTVVTVAESSHYEAKLDTLGRPQRIKGIRMAVTAQSQFGNPFTLAYNSPNGGKVSKLWQPANYQSPRNYNALIIEDDSFTLPLDQNTYIEFAVNAGETITVTTWVADRVETYNVLNNKQVLTQSRAGMPTGLTPEKVVVEPGNTRNFYGRR